MFLQDVVLTVAPYLSRLSGGHCRHHDPGPQGIPLPLPPCCTPPLQPPPPPQPSPNPLQQQQATLRVSGPSPRAGGRPGPPDLDDPAVAAAAAAAGSGGSFYPLMRSEASGSQDLAASTEPCRPPRLPQQPSLRRRRWRRRQLAGSRTPLPEQQQIPARPTTSTRRLCSATTSSAARDSWR